MLIEPATVAQRAEKLRALKSPQNTKNKAKKKGEQVGRLSAKELKMHSNSVAKR